MCSLKFRPDLVFRRRTSSRRESDNAFGQLLDILRFVTIKEGDSYCLGGLVCRRENTGGISILETVSVAQLNLFNPKLIVGTKTLFANRIEPRRKLLLLLLLLFFLYYP